jgi:hypothetical protein
MTSPQIKWYIIFLYLVGFSVLYAQDIQYIDQYNVVWNSQSENAAGSMPVGGGDTGLNVWVENDEILFYIQRSGIHDEYNGFPKLGRVRLWCEPNILKGAESFRQELKLRESCIEIEAQHPKHGSFLLKIWVEVHRPVIHVEMESSEDIQLFTQFESWRTQPRALDKNSNLGERWGWWDLEGWPGDVILEPDFIEPDDTGVTFYHVNPDEKLASRKAYENMGLGEYYGQYFDPLKDLVWGGRLTGSNLVFDGTSEGTYVITPYKAWRYRSQSTASQHQLNLFLQTDRSGSPVQWKTNLEKLEQSPASSSKDAWQKNLNWWGEFWARSHLLIRPESPNEQDPVWQVGRNYQLFRYMVGCNAFGENPTMFNGGLFSFDPSLVMDRFPFHPDWRRWGGGIYTLQNQRWVYWPMLKWGDFSLMHNQFDFFTRVLDVAEMRSNHYFGHDGAMFEESAPVYGLPIPMIYGYENSTLDSRLRKPWMEPGISRNWAVRYHRTAMLEFAYMILEYHRMSGQSIDEWLPFVKSVMTFYDEHYQVRSQYNAKGPLNKDGKLVIFPSSVCESHWIATDPLPDVAGLHAVIQGIASLPESIRRQLYPTDEDIAGLQKRIPDYYYEKIYDDIVLPPAQATAYNNYNKTELYICYPLFPFNQFKLGTPEMSFFENTVKHWTTWQTERAFEFYAAWGYANVMFARMGHAERAADLTVKKIQDGELRFPAFFGPGTDWLPDMNRGGSGAVGLQEMLMQTIGDEIRLLPAWPKEWDCDFKLHAPKQTIVEGEVRNGVVRNLKVTPEERAQDVVMHRE